MAKVDLRSVKKSFGTLEVSAREASASELLGLRVGARVSFARAAPPSRR